MVVQPKKWTILVLRSAALGGYITFRSILRLVNRNRVVVEYFRVNDPIVIRGNSFILTWRVHNATHVSINGLGLFLPKGWIRLKADFEERTFIFKAFGNCGPVQKRIEIRTAQVEFTQTFGIAVEQPRPKELSKALLIDRLAEIEFIPAVPRPEFACSNGFMTQVPQPRLHFVESAAEVINQLKKSQAA